MPRDKKKSKPTPSNARAMSDILHLLHTDPPQLPSTKESRITWLETQLLPTTSYPYPGTKKDMGKHHTAESLHEAITYAVRDGKKDEFKALTGQAAIARFFELGDAMLKGGFLLAIGYHQRTTEEESERVEMQGGEGVKQQQQQDPLAAPMVQVEERLVDSNRPRACCGLLRGNSMLQQECDVGVQDASLLWRTRESPQLLSTEKSELKLCDSTTQLDSVDRVLPPIVEEPHEVIYEPIRPISSITKRKSLHLGSGSDDEQRSMAVDQDNLLSPVNDSNTSIALPDTRIQNDLLRLRDTIAELSASLCPSHASVHLKGWPNPTLFAIYADMFGCLGWRHTFEDLVEGNGMRPSVLLQAVIWSFLDIHIFRQPLPWPQLTVQSIMGDRTKATESATARWKHELSITVSTISLEQLEDVIFFHSNIRPKGARRAECLGAVLSEHLADDSSSPFPGVLTDLSSQAIASLQRICEEALVLQGRMEVGESEYRLFKHKPGSSMHQESSPVHDGRVHKRRKAVVALTVAPGLERKDVQDEVRDVVDAFVTMEPAIIVTGV